jgi:hypothetical protein
LTAAEDASGEVQGPVKVRTPLSAQGIEPPRLKLDFHFSINRVDLIRMTFERAFSRVHACDGFGPDLAQRDLSPDKGVDHRAASPIHTLYVDHEQSIEGRTRPRT